MLREDKRRHPEPLHPGDLEGDPMNKASSQEKKKKGCFIYKCRLKNSCHDSGMWPGSRMLKHQNIKAALCVGVGSE